MRCRTRQLLPLRRSRHSAGAGATARSCELPRLLAGPPEVRQVGDLLGGRAHAARRRISAWPSAEGCDRRGGGPILAAPRIDGDGDTPSPIRLRVLSLGAGVQSTTLAPMVAHGWRTDLQVSGDYVGKAAFCPRRWQWPSLSFSVIHRTRSGFAKICSVGAMQMNVGHSRPLRAEAGAVSRILATCPENLSHASRNASVPMA